MSKDFKIYVQDMLGAAQKIMAAAGDTPAEELGAGGFAHDAVLYNFIVLGEAASRVPVEIRERAPGIPWRSIIGMRNAIAHGYDTVSLETVSQTIENELPGLIRELEKVIKEWRC